MTRKRATAGALVALALLFFTWKTTAGSKPSVGNSGGDGDSAPGFWDRFWHGQLGSFLDSMFRAGSSLLSQLLGNLLHFTIPTSGGGSGSGGSGGSGGGGGGGYPGTTDTGSTDTGTTNTGTTDTGSTGDPYLDHLQSLINQATLPLVTGNDLASRPILQNIALTLEKIAEQDSIASQHAAEMVNGSMLVKNALATVDAYYLDAIKSSTAGPAKAFPTGLKLWQLGPDHVTWIPVENIDGPVNFDNMTLPVDPEIFANYHAQGYRVGFIPPNQSTIGSIPDWLDALNGGDYGRGIQILESRIASDSSQNSFLNTLASMGGTILSGLTGPLGALISGAAAGVNIAPGGSTGGGVGGFSSDGHGGFVITRP